MASFDYWLFIKSWHFSDWKTSWSIREIKMFDPFTQVNITNQPTGYSHIQINTASDLSNLVKDIFNYNKYYCQYEVQMNQYELYKWQLENFKKWLKNIQPESLNLEYKKWFFMKIKLWFQYKIWNLPRSNITKSQLVTLIENQEKYFTEREAFLKLYWDDLLLYMECFMSLDELHLFFWSRAWKENFKWDEWQKLIELITFPVKMRVRIDGIVQNPSRLDKNFREQSSLYIKHEAKFFDLCMMTYYYDVKDSNAPDFSEDELVKKRLRINWYKLTRWNFWKIQYVRENFIDLSNTDIYKPWLFFDHLRMMTDLFYAHHPKDETPEENVSPEPTTTKTQEQEKK